MSGTFKTSLGSMFGTQHFFQVSKGCFPPQVETRGTLDLTILTRGNLMVCETKPAEIMMFFPTCNLMVFSHQDADVICTTTISSGTLA